MHFALLLQLMYVYPMAFTLQLENYAKTEEAKVEELIKAVADSGAQVIVSGGASVGEMALHFCERYKYDLNSLISMKCCFMFLSMLLTIMNDP